MRARDIARVNAVVGIRAVIENDNNSAGNSHLNDLECVDSLAGVIQFCFFGFWWARFQLEATSFVGTTVNLFRVRKVSRPDQASRCQLVCAQGRCGKLKMPNETADKLVAQYCAGERRFTDLNLEDSPNFKGANLAGAVFDGSWLFGADFRGCNLRDASFRRCNLKCSDFRKAGLRSAVFEAALEGSEFGGAILDGTQFGGSTAYGHVFNDGELPPK